MLMRMVLWMVLRLGGVSEWMVCGGGLIGVL